jgi:hypothetical protein
MALGSIAFNVPPSMSLNQAETVKLLLRAEQASEELQKTLRDQGVVGDIRTATIRIHDRMQAVLLGDGFQISPVTADTLPISKQEPTQWEWDVRAQRYGTLKLNVVLNAIVDVNDGSGPRPYTIRTFSQTYIVQVPGYGGRVATFAKNNWPWLIATVAILVGGWLWNRKGKKRRTFWRAFPASEGSGIFISYRRDDSAGHVGRLHDGVAAHFGADRVFLDIGDIRHGEDFVKAIEKAVSSSVVLVVVIGRQWLSIVDKNGQRRLDNPHDFVRQEIAIALQRGIKIVPALVQGAAMPGEDALPPPLVELASRNAIEISDSRWQFDMDRLIETLEDELSRKHS